MKYSSNRLIIWRSQVQALDGPRLNKKAVTMFVTAFLFYGIKAAGWPPFVLYGVVCHILVTVYVWPGRVSMSYS